MFRRGILVFNCLIILLAPVVGNSEHSPLQSAQSWDYFTLREGASGASSLVQYTAKKSLDSAIVKLQQGKLRDAIADCSVVLDRIANHPKALVILGFTAKLAKEPSLPLPYYERAVKMFPQRAMTHAQYGKYLSDIGRAEEGEKKLQQAIQLDPQLKVAYTWLAHLYMRRGQSDLARQALQQSHQVDTLPLQSLENQPDLKTDSYQQGEGKRWGERGEQETADDPSGGISTEETAPTE